MRERNPMIGRYMIVLDQPHSYNHHSYISKIHNWPIILILHQAASMPRIDRYTSIRKFLLGIKQRWWAEVMSKTFSLLIVSNLEHIMRPAITKSRRKWSVFKKGTSLTTRLQHRAWWWPAAWAQTQFRFHQAAYVFLVVSRSCIRRYYACVYHA